MPGFLQKLVDFFVITFGITKPKPGQEKLAAVFILGLIALIAVIILTGVFTLIRVLG